MKLRNKKTGKIIESARSSAVIKDKIRIYDELNDKSYTYNSLAELNAEWEDYEEPKESKKYWFINPCGEVISFYEEYENPADTKASKAIGDYFETREEAELAVEKLKAWKRLKDSGAEIVNYGCYGGTNTKGEFSGEIKVTIDVPHEEDKYLFQLLFGGEE